MFLFDRRNDTTSLPKHYSENFSPLAEKLISSLQILAMIFLKTACDVYTKVKKLLSTVELYSDTFSFVIFYRLIDM